MTPGSFWKPLEVVLSLACLAVLGIAFALDPDARGHGTHQQLGLPPCGYLMATGKPCVSCGMTTAFAHMAHAAPRAAWHANPMGAILFLLVLIAPIWLIHAFITGLDPLRFTRHPIGRWLLPGLVVGCLVLMVLRA